MNVNITTLVAMAVIGLSMSIGCQSKAPASASGAQQASREALATLTRKGGIAGMNDKATLLADGSFTFEQRSGTRQGQLSADALQGVRSAFDATISLDANYPADRHSADGFEYTLTYRGRTIRWSEAAPNLPAALTRVAELFGRSFAGTKP